MSSTRAVALMLAWFIVSHTCLAYIVHIQCKIYTYQWATVSRVQSLHGVVVSICIFISWIMILECGWETHVYRLGSSTVLVCSARILQTHCEKWLPMNSFWERSNFSLIYLNWIQDLSWGDWKKSKNYSYIHVLL